MAISRKRVQVVHKKSQRFWVLVDGKRVGLVAKHFTEGDWIYRKLGFNTTPKPARTKNEAVDRLLMELDL